MIKLYFSKNHAQMAINWYFRITIKKFLVILFVIFVGLKVLFWDIAANNASIMDVLTA